MDKPSVGRIVHVHHAGVPCVAAIVVNVYSDRPDDQLIEAVAFPPHPLGITHGVFKAASAPDEDHAWHWPERVP